MEHGTVQMYRKELRSGDAPCIPCKKAQAEYMDGYRLLKPRDRSTETRNATIKRRALNRLAQEHPERLSALIAEEWHALL